MASGSLGGLGLLVSGPGSGSSSLSSREGVDSSFPTCWIFCQNLVRNRARED